MSYAKLVRKNGPDLQFPVMVMGAGKKLMYTEFWNRGLKRNMPSHFKEYHNLWRQGPQLHIHSRPKQANFEKDEFGEIYPVQNPRIYVVYPDKFHEGLWGGEGVIKGLLKREEGRHRNFTPPAAKYWWPQLFEGVVHSEILDRYIELIMTKRGIQLVDEAYGFDNYLLSTPVNEVYATGLLRIKRELLLTLSDKENFTTRQGRSPALYDKYSQFVVPYEEADWHGLTLSQAKMKQAAIERGQARAEEVPSKQRYRRELVEMLRSGDTQDLDLLVETEESKSGGVMGGIKDMFGVK